MEDKEYKLGNNARELLKYTNRATKPVGDDVSLRDVRGMLSKIAAMEDIRAARQVCVDTIGAMDRGQREGFTKRAYRCYGEDMRKIAAEIVRDVHAANGRLFATEYEERLALIGRALDECALMLEYIQICLDLGYISLKKSEVWTKKVTDVKYMLAAWKKKDGQRAAKLREDAARSADLRQIELVKEAIRVLKYS